MIDTSDTRSILELLFHSVPMPIAVFDADMRYLAANPCWLASYNLGGREIIGRSHYEVTPEIPEAWRLAHRLALQGMEHQEGEFHHHREHGADAGQWIRWKVQPWRHADGEIGGIVIFTEDITARKANEEALRKSEAYLHTLFQSVSDYVLLLEPQASGPALIADGNDAAFAKHGYTRDEMIGQPITRFETEASARPHEDRVARVKQGGPAHFEIEHVCKDGSTFFARVSAKEVEDGSGDRKILVVEQDITALKQAEERQQMLLKENRRLTHRLMQVQEDERRQLARSLHDNLGQILTSINASAFYIARRSDDADIREAARQIGENAQLIFDATDEILLRLRPGALDALGLEAALIELAASWRKHSGTECMLHLDEAADRLPESHTIAIYRLVQEGLTHAIRHGKASRVDVRLRLWAAPAESAMLRLEIADNGMAADSEPAPSDLGIVGMRERVRALGGGFVLSALPQGGLHIEATIPLPDQQHDALPAP